MKLLTSKKNLRLIHLASSPFILIYYGMKLKLLSEHSACHVYFSKFMFLFLVVVQKWLSGLTNNDSPDSSSYCLLSWTTWNSLSVFHFLHCCCWTIPLLQCWDSYSWSACFAIDFLSVIFCRHVILLCKRHPLDQHQLQTRDSDKTTSKGVVSWDARALWLLAK